MPGRRCHTYCHKGYLARVKGGCFLSHRWSGFVGVTNLLHTSPCLPFTNSRSGWTWRSFFVPHELSPRLFSFTAAWPLLSLGSMTVPFLRVAPPRGQADEPAVWNFACGLQEHYVIEGPTFPAETILLVWGRLFRAIQALASPGPNVPAGTTQERQ